VKNGKLFFVAVAMFGLVASEASAWTLRRSHTNVSVTASAASVTVSSYGSPQAAASSKASRMAASGTFRHLGGGFGGGRYEGIGRGPTPQSALANCCYTGQRPLLASSVVWSSRLGSYVAVKIFR